MTTVLDDFQDVLRRLVKVNGSRTGLVETIATNEKAYSEALALEQDWTRAADVVRSFSDEEGERLKSKIEALVSMALTSIFAEQMDFRVISSVKYRSASVEFELTSNGVARPLVGSHGGGVSQVTGFILRVVVVLLSRSLRPALFLDEPFSQVSVEFRPRLAAFIRELVDSTKLQLVIVTHDSDLPQVADVHYRFSAVAGQARVLPAAASD